MSDSTSSSISSSSDENEDEEKQVNLIKHKPKFSCQKMKPCSIRTFAENIFRYCPFLMQHTDQVDDILSKWKVFKHAVPTNGAIILDQSLRYVLLVQGFWTKASWGFPKGKIFEEETESKCAIREVLEETGYDISDTLCDEEYLQININDQTIRLYLITGVSKEVKFEPKTRREIKEVRWFAIDELPVHRKDNRTKFNLGYSPNSFFMVIPFVKALKKWISQKKISAPNQVVKGGNIDGIYGNCNMNSTTIKTKDNMNNRKRINNNFNMHCRNRKNMLSNSIQLSLENKSKGYHNSNDNLLNNNFSNNSSLLVLQNNNKTGNKNFNFLESKREFTINQHLTYTSKVPKNEIVSIFEIN